MTPRLKENLETRMNDLKLNQTQLSKLSKVPKATIHGYLNPTSSSLNKIDVKQIKRICDVLKMDMHKLLFGVPDPNSETSIPKEFLNKLFEGDIRVTIHKIERR